MVAMIFAAGLGTRLKPLTDTMPKALVPLAGKTLLQWQVERLRDAGIRDIIINVHHFPDQIIDAVRANDGWGCHIVISDERELLLDTGGGLRKAMRLIAANGQGQTANEPVLACNVDILSNIDLGDLMQRYHETGVSQLVVSERQTQRYLCFNDQNLLQGWVNIATGEQKGLDGRHLAFSGLQILSPEVLARLDEMEEAKFSLIDFYLYLCHRPLSPSTSPLSPFTFHLSPFTFHLSPFTFHLSPLMAYVPADYRMMDVGKIDQIEQAEQFARSLE